MEIRPGGMGTSLLPDNESTIQPITYSPWIKTQSEYVCKKERVMAQQRLSAIPQPYEEIW